jgi:hypothetical protein
MINPFQPIHNHTVNVETNSGAHTCDNTSQQCHTEPMPTQQTLQHTRHAPLSTAQHNSGATQHCTNHTAPALFSRHSPAAAQATPSNSPPARALTTPACLLHQPFTSWPAWQPWTCARPGPPRGSCSPTRCRTRTQAAGGEEGRAGSVPVTGDPIDAMLANGPRGLEVTARVN